MSEQAIAYHQEYISSAAADHVTRYLSKTLSAPKKLCNEQLLHLLDKPQEMLLTPSCTAALEMMAILLDVKAGDEIIMPSYTFPSTANAFVLRGAKPVFVDVHADMPNLDVNLIEPLITTNTRAILAMHYAGVGCDMPALVKLCKQHNLVLLEDAAQCLDARYDGQALGTFGALSAFSFHHTKNLGCGEGGLLVINDPQYIHRADIIQEKGTDRRQFLRGEVNKYQWVDIGSSYVLSDLSAAYLAAQLPDIKSVTKTRLQLWQYYYDGLTELAANGHLHLANVGAKAEHNAHIFFIYLQDGNTLQALNQHMKDEQIHPVTHYVPLHNTPMGQQYCLTPQALPNTEMTGECLLRLPLHTDLTQADQDRVIASIKHFFHN